MIVCGQTFSSSILKRIQRTVDADPNISRLVLSRQTCKWLKWRGENGTWKEMSCRVALLKLHQRGKICLPSPTRRFPVRGEKERECFLEREKKELSCDFKETGLIELVKVNGRQKEESRLWNEMMEKHHYLKSSKLCGAQLRYLVKSSKHGCLGGLSFSSAAWRLKSRDQWIGWDESSRRKNLGKVVCNSRFLILPWVNIPNLASHLLSMSIKRMKEDWLEQYGVSPILLETFVERGRFKGTCYQAANWMLAGETRGRGRQDRENAYMKTVKDVYLYPLREDAQERLRVGSKVILEEPVLLAKPKDWAEEEFGGVRLKDKRLRNRLLVMARDLGDRPQANIPEACGSRSKTKAAYRFFDHSETTLETLLLPHYESTVKRIEKEAVVLAVQDTTSLNYSAHRNGTTGLGPIGSKKEGAVGLELHDTLAFNVEGVPLGVLDAQCWARNSEEFGKKHQRGKKPIEEKESYKWFLSYKKATATQKRCAKTMVVSIGDREADIYELFKLAVEETSGAKLLVRAEHNRLLADEQGHLWEALRGQTLSGAQILHVPRCRKLKRPAREAHLEVRFAQVRLKPPKQRPELGELSVWAILAEETEAPEGQDPLTWMLLTTVEVHNFEQALEKLEWYAKRWGIETYHRTLKSGCKIEERQLGNAERIESCLAIDMVVAWRVFRLTMLGREMPNVPCTVFFEEAEWKALHSYVHKDPKLPKEPPSLREANRMVASLGGFLGRKSDGDPGTKSLWIGLQRLDDLSSMWVFMARSFAPHLMTNFLSSNPGYG